MLVYCGQTVGWIRMPLGMEVGLGPDHNVSDGNPAPPPKKGAQLTTHTICNKPCNIQVFRHKPMTLPAVPATTVQQLLRWATVPEQSGPKSRRLRCPFPMPIFVPTGILIRPTVWPQYTNVTDRQTGQTGQQSHSIGRTVFQTVAQKGNSAYRSDSA